VFLAAIVSCGVRADEPALLRDLHRVAHDAHLDHSETWARIGVCLGRHSVGAEAVCWQNARRTGSGDLRASD